MEQWDSGAGSPRTLRLRTDDGPIVELDMVTNDTTVKGKLRIWDPSVAVPSPPLGDLSGCTLREEYGASDKLAQWWANANRTDAQLWTAMSTFYSNKKPRWDQVSAAATAAANAATSIVPTIPLDALTAAYRRATLAVLP